MPTNPLSPAAEAFLQRWSHLQSGPAGFAPAMRADLAALLAAERGAWTPTSEALPPEGAEVLVWVAAAGGYHEIARRDGTAWDLHDPEAEVRCPIEGVTHWRRLPAGPEGGGR